MKITQLVLPGCLLIQPVKFPDKRGHFQELWSAERYKAIGIKHSFVQDNYSYSTKGVVRGMHFQRRQPQGKLVTVLSGEIFDVMVDIRPDSDHFGKWLGITLSASNTSQLWIPPGFAHGFQVLSSEASVMYKTTTQYDVSDEGAFLYCDEQLDIQWPLADAIVSEKDQIANSFYDSIIMGS